MSPADIIVFKELGLEVLTIDEDCKRQVQRPTMFYMPFPIYYLIGNLLGANWSPSCINQILLLTNSFHHLLPIMRPCKLNSETMQRLERILPFTTEVDIKTYDNIYMNVFSKFAWHFFDVGPNIDMETSLSVTEIAEYEETDEEEYCCLDTQEETDEEEYCCLDTQEETDEEECSWLDTQRDLEKQFFEDMQSDGNSYVFAVSFGQYRGPHRLRCNSLPPPPGWIKLNIYGIGTEGDQLGRYSGVFQDETGKFLDKYSGNTDVEDNVIAGLEALRLGLVRCVEGKLNTEKLIVESDNVILVQYVNHLPEPNEITMRKLLEIFDLMERLTCAVYRVYEEANEAARDLALRDERV